MRTQLPSYRTLTQRNRKPAVGKIICFPTRLRLWNLSTYYRDVFKTRIQQLEERREQASGSEAWDDSDDRRFQVVMGELTNRGTGVYHCPKLGRCDKGGVDKDGNLVPFERNSSFV